MWDWLTRKRSSLLWIAGGTAGVYFLGKYAGNQIRQLTKQAELESLAKENIKRRFEQNQQDLFWTSMALMPSVVELLLGEDSVVSMPVESLTAQVRSLAALKDSAPEQKAQRDEEKKRLWNEIKIQALARTICAIYALLVLHIFNGAQLNIIGRFTYLDSLHSLDQSENDGDQMKIKSIPTAAEAQFLALSHHLLQTILPTLNRHILQVVTEKVDPLPLNHFMSSIEFEERMEEIRNEIDAYVLENTAKWVPVDSVELSRVIAAGLSQQPDVNTSVELEEKVLKMAKELRYFLTSDAIRTIWSTLTSQSIQQMNKAVLSQVFTEEQLKKAMNMKNGGAPKIQELDKDGQEVDEGKVAEIPWARFLPALTKHAHVVLNNYPNTYLQLIHESKEYKAFNAIIYSSFDHM